MRKFRDSNEQSLKEVIEYLLKAYRIDGRVNEQRLISNWENVVGPMIGKYTTSLRIHHKVLFVELTSSVVRNELNYAKEKLVKSLNDTVGARVINRIVLK
ncbi:MAG: DUF721 domain-containing protein [Bacteroidota bacterium]|nr:DUF721 domain-containing protein [Bacteroidota bacterium]